MLHGQGLNVAWNVPDTCTSQVPGQSKDSYPCCPRFFGLYEGHNYEQRL
jgi:hypothetical protein